MFELCSKFSLFLILFLLQYSASLFNKLLGGFLVQKSVPQGAATTVYGCVAPYLSTDAMRGVYLEDCRASLPTTDAGLDEDKKMRQELWRVTDEQLTAACLKAGL